MNDNILIEIICPAVSRRWDFRIPSNIKIADIKLQIISDIQIYEGMEMIFSNIEETIIIRKDGTILNSNFTALEAGIKSGDTLLII